MCEVPKDGSSSSTCTTSCPSYLYESKGMSPYDVLMDVHALYWEAGFTDGIVVSFILGPRVHDLVY